MIPVLNVQSFGAIGNDVHDDTTAIANGTAAALASGTTLYFPNTQPDGVTPVVAYKVTAETVANGPVKWCGDSSGAAQTIVRAHVSMRSILAIRATFGQTGTIVTRSDIERITFDANFGGGAQRAAILLIGATGGRFDQVLTENCIGSGIRAAGVVLPAIIGAVTPTVPGGSPAGVAVTQPDVNYITINDSNVVIKVTTPGALGTARFKTSFDGGSTFQAIDQPISDPVQVGLMDSHGVALVTSGINATFPSGTYHVNDTYAFSVTLQIADETAAIANNTDCEFYNCYFDSNGTINSTAPFAAGFSGRCAAVVVQPGTIATTIGSPIIVGTSTTFMSMGAKEGDILFANSAYYAIAIVLDDTHIAVVAGMEPTTAASGLDWAVATGAGYTEDGNGDENRQQFFGGYTVSNCIGFHIAGSQGPSLHRIHMIGYGIVGMSIGGSTNNLTQNCAFIEPHAEAVRPAYLFCPGTTGTIIEPAEVFSFVGGPGGWIIHLKGVIFPIGTVGLINLPINSLILASTPFTFVSAASTIPAPDVGQPAGHGTYIPVSAPSQLLLNGSPTVGPAVDGAIVIIFNVGAFPITFQTDTFAATGLNLWAQYITLGFQESIHLRFQGGKWYQIGQGIYFGNGETGNKGPGSRVFKTSTNAPFVLWDIDCAISAGTLAQFTVKAQSRGGLDVAFWYDNVVAYDILGNRIVFTPGPHVTTGGAAATWALNVIDAPPFGNVTGVGDNINPIFWEIEMAAKSPPVSF